MRGSFDCVWRECAPNFAQDDDEGQGIFSEVVIGWGEAGVYILHAACSQSRYDRLRNG
jgi:hypothetical protein